MYAVTEIFYTLQGEGQHTGTPAQFIRFAGCNLWSGRADDRARDAERSAAACPMFCDTDFMARGRMSIDKILERCEAPANVPLVVLTGGEPMLQLDHELVLALRRNYSAAEIAIETNGTRKVPSFVDWVCVSPKVADSKIEQRGGDELKVVLPAYSPEDYADLAHGFEHLWVSAEAKTEAVGRSVIVSDNLARAARWCMANPSWRLTLQAHKVLGLP